MTPEQLYEQVRKNSSAILADADAGNATAKAIEASYNMLVRFPENCALAILESSFEKWISSHLAPEENARAMPSSYPSSQTASETRGGDSE